jgi:uncharacterized protein YjaG (DUF416 family)
VKPKQFEKRLGQLRAWREYAFILCLAERNFPNFALFADLTAPAHSTRVRQLLDQGWQMLGSRDHNLDVFQLLTHLSHCAPDPDAHDVYGVQPALTMVELLEQAFLCRANPDKPRAPVASQASLAVVMTFIELSEGEGLDDQAMVDLFENHELMQAEQGFQEYLLETLGQARAPDEILVEQLRGVAHNEGVSNLGIALGDTE